MSKALLIPFDPAGLDPKTANALDESFAAIQTWAGKLTASQEITGSFTAVQPRCLFTESTSIPNLSDNTTTLVTWASLGSTTDVIDDPITGWTYDNGSLFGRAFLRVAADSKLYPPVAGLYHVNAAVTFDGNATGTRLLRLNLLRDGVSHVAVTVSAPGDAVANRLHGSVYLPMRDASYGDCVTLDVKQTSGGLLLLSKFMIQLVKVS